MKAILFCALILFSIFGCTHKAKQPAQPQTIIPPKERIKKLSITPLGYVEFDRSFSFLQSFTLSEKEIDKLYKETENSNPVFMPSAKKDSLKKRLEELGIVKGDELLLNKIKFKTKNKFQLNSNTGEIANGEFQRELNTGIWTLKIVSKIDSLQLKLDSQAMELQYLLLDIIPGGFPEIVLLDQEHISNNDLYRLIIYEIKSEAP